MPTPLDTLRAELERWSRLHHEPVDGDGISSGCESLDQLLPRGGFWPGQLVEWSSARVGGGAGMLAWLVAVRAAGPQGTIVVVDGNGTFYPPAALAWGLAPPQVMVVRPQNAADTIWALDQTLRCPAVTAVWTALDKLAAKHFRRLQLAAEEGATLGLLLRPATARGQPSWSDLHLAVEPLVENNSATKSQARHAQPTYRRVWTVSVLRCRGGTAGASIQLQLEEQTGNLQLFDATSDSHETRALHLAAQLARPAARRRSARA